MVEHQNKVVKIKFTKKRVLIIFLLVLVVFSFYVAYRYFQPITEVTFGNIIMAFRVDLRETKKVPITPDEVAFNREFISNMVENVTIVYKPTNDDTDSFYSVEAFEIVNKFYYGYKRINYTPTFQTKNVTTYEGVFGTIKNPVIVLIHPKYGNETSVKLDFHTAIISAKNDTNPKIALKNFDLATEKFIIATLGIKV